MQKKTKVMHIKGSRNTTEQHIHINGTQLENVQDFKYLGSTKSEDSTCSKDIRTRIGMAKQKMVQLNNIWKDRGIATDLKLILLKCLVWPVMLYGCEAWTCRKADEKRLEAAEMWLYRRLLRIPWTDKRTNVSVLKELNASKKILETVNKRRLKYVGHIIRNKNTNLMAATLQGKIEARKKQGRPSVTYIENIKKVSNMNIQEMAHRSLDRVIWRRAVQMSGVAANIDHDDADR